MRKMTERDRFMLAVLVWWAFLIGMFVLALYLSVRPAHAADLQYQTTGTTRDHRISFEPPAGMTRYRLWFRDAFAPAGSPWTQGADYTYVSASCRYAGSHALVARGKDLCVVPPLASRTSVYRVWFGVPDAAKPGGVDWRFLSDERNRLRCTKAPNGDSLCTVNPTL